MERQRSFSVKSTRVVLAFIIITISSAIVFFTFFSASLIKSNSPDLLYSTTDSNFHISDLSPKASLSVTDNLNSSVSPQANPILTSTHFNPPENTSKVSVFEQKIRGDKVIIANLTSIKVIELPSSIGEEEKTKKKRRIEECDVTKGKWVYDSDYYPLYTNASCPFIDEGFGCQSNGRLDLNYMNWRWDPQDCDAPRFNATKMLEMIRGKRLVFVGDSINRNQWESMLCLLFQAVKDPKRVYETHNRRITKEKGNYSFRFLDYKCTVEFYVTHFLVREGRARIGKKRRETLRIDAMDRSSSRWKGANILVFNTAHWWSHYKTKSGVNYYQEGDQIHPKLDVSTAFKKALQTWSSWVDKNVDPKKTRVFFRSAAPSHFSGGEWNSGGHCREANMPLNQTFKPSYSSKNSIVEEVLKQMRTPVTLLNVSGLSQYRIDAHPSIYGTKPENRRSKAVQDCSHWCLPGVPDTWNHFLYLHLLHKR
ncbi:PREDICTED: protein trichome birefringence-like 6 [Camelina sativa]|uniref:Protein trichome birefringence-like 6 n=1 Tax=Camelina sativa TaxID=90675 RepID=A0ABM0ZA73_CAMSA|nr:PREDICTED: protein trichome birefringence-like 6 [Camelina sativa]